MVVCRYWLQNVKDGILIHVYNINNELLNHCSQLISVKVKKNLRKSKAQFREMLRKLRLRQNNDFLIKKVYYITQGGLGGSFQFSDKVLQGVGCFFRCDIKLFTQLYF